jgi:hypothetical protein
MKSMVKRTAGPIAAAVLPLLLVPGGAAGASPSISIGTVTIAPSNSFK